MYSSLVRSTFAGVARANIRNYATRRVLTESSSTPLPTTRSFQSAGKLKGQPGLAEVPSHSEERANSFYNGGLHPEWQIPPTTENSHYEQNPTQLAGTDQSTRTSKGS